MAGWIDNGEADLGPTPAAALDDRSRDDIGLLRLRDACCRLDTPVSMGVLTDGC